MKSKSLVAGNIVLSLLFLFAGIGLCQVNEKMSMDQWIKTIAPKSDEKVPPGAGNEGAFASSMGQGSALQEQKKYQEAIGAFSEAIKLKPDSAEAYRRRGIVRLRIKDMVGAMNDCKKAIELDPDNEKAYYLKGTILREQNDHEGAIAAYQEAVKLKPGYSAAIVSIAKIKIDMGNHSDAISDLNKLLTTEPNNLDALISRGYAFKQLKNYSEARADFKKALEISPDNAFAAKNLKSLDSLSRADTIPEKQIPPGISPGKSSPQPSPADQTPSPSGPLAIADAGAAPPPVQGGQENSRMQRPVYDPPARPKDGILKEDDPCKPNLDIGDLVWSTVQSQPEKNAISEDSKSRFKDLLVFSDTRYNQPVTTAKAQIAYLMGNISLQDQYKFDEKWACFFNYPSEETTEYFKKLVPLMADLIEKKNQLSSAVIARDDAQKDADDAISNESKEAQADALDIVDQQTGIIKGLQQEMEALASQVQALGDPPNPLEKACKAKKKHEDAKKVVKNTLKAMIIPNKLKGKINTEYKFKAEISEIGEDAQLYWDFSDGENATAKPGQEVSHTFKKAGKFLVKLSIINPEAQNKAQIAESKALITGPNPLENEKSKDAGDTKFNFIAKDPFEVSNLPDGCTVVKNEGSENRPIHGNESLKDYLYYTFNVYISCKEKIFTKGGATLEYMVKPVPFKIYATPATVSLYVEYYPPDNILYKNRVESMSKLLASEKEMKWMKAEPYKFGGWGANGRIVGYDSVKTPLSKSDDRRRHEVDFYGIGQERTTVNFKVNTLVGYNADSSGVDCRKDGSYCGNVLENQIVGKFRDGLRDQLATIHVAYYNELEKLAAGMKLKGLPYPYVKEDTEEAPDPWLNDDGTPLTEDEFKRKQEALVEAEKFYKSDIEILQKNLAREEADYGIDRGNSKDAWDAKAAIAFRIRAIKADIQAEQDKINTLYTGKVVHTRTEYDDYTHNKFVERVKEEQEKFIKIQKDRAILRKETNKLPAEEREKALKFINDKINEKTVSNLDDETVNKVAEAIFNKTQGYNEAEAAKYEDESLMWDDYTTRAEKVKFWSDIGMLGCSFLEGPMAVSAAYDITTGYFQGGPKEAATQILLQTGAFALGKYMSGAAKAAAGAEETLEAAKTVSKQSKNISKGLSAQEELRIFQKNRKEGEKIVQEFSNLNNDLKKAYLGKASKEEIALIKQQIRAKTIEIQANPHAKNFLKYGNDKLTQVRFNRSIKNVHSEVEKKFYEKMRSDKYKWGDFEVKEMRNASSSGSVGMDYDIGLIEKPNFMKLPDGTMKPQYWLTKEGKPATRKLWQAEAQECWNEAYKEVTLKDAGKSWENITTKLHPESYQDLAVLDGNMSKVSKEWIQQTSDVTRYKSMHMMNDPSLSKFEKLQEISRGMAKDANTKLMPLLGNMKKTTQVYEAADHWKKVTSVLDDFGKNKIDPITAERRIAELTGGKSIPEVVDDMSYMMESIVKLGK